MSAILIIIIAGAAIQPLAAVAEATEEQDQKIGSYEECALRVFETSKKVSDVFDACEAEMNAYTAMYDARAREKLAQKVKVETRRALTDSTLPQKDDQDD